MLTSGGRARPIAAALYVLGSALFLTCAVCSFRRHIHVDEASALYSIQLGARFGHGDYASIELSSVLLRPLSRALGSSQRIFVGFRCFELLLLVTLCFCIAQVQRSLPSAPGKAAVFLGAVAFGPLWRHGFEVRHDLYLAFEIVLLAWAAERARSGRFSWLVASVAGLGSILVQANASKAFTIWLPALGLCALLAARGARPWLEHAWRALLGFVPGLLLGLGLVALVLGQAGILGEYLRQLHQFTNFSSSPPYRLSALPLLSFAIERAPVHALFVLVGLVSVPLRLILRQELERAWVPLAALCLSALALAVNPTPFPYNLTWLTPSWLLMSAFGAAQSFQLVRRARRRALAPVLAVVTGGLALNSFWSCEQDPYYRKNWDAQLRVVAGAEALTKSDEPVLDLCGLIVSRPPVAKDWVVHSLFMPAYHAGQRESVRHIIERVWPPVTLTVYRWGFLDRSDLLALRRNYLPFSTDLWTLGSTLNPSLNQFELHRAGHYRVRAPANDAGTIDGRLVHDGDVLWLERGGHALATAQRYTVAWAGPGALQEPPAAANPLFEQGELLGQRDSK